MSSLKNNYLLRLAYDGTEYSGWQKQPGFPTIQAELEKAIERLFHFRATVTGAARTDGGVHAAAQAASVVLPKDVVPYRLVEGLNAVLPKDISVSSAKKVPARFNARYDAKYKIYEYRVWNMPHRSVWAAHAWHIREPLDTGLMRRAAHVLRGRHDFSAFGAARGSQKDKVVTVRKIAIRKREGLLILSFQADRFLYKMVRNMAGTLVAVGRGAMQSQDIAGILAGRKRSLAGPTAPSKGLFLMKVKYQAV